ncbi:MAG: mandelate racemase/muconate lactonizing enzyme family protein [Spirochaetales bacterium]|nr:mandelate racemase/muconate lactonizing enzyme family protein [Spirochaetales bacterium]
MKITDVTAYALKAPVETETCFSQAWISLRSSVIIRIDTDEGVTGWGESLCHGGQPPEMAKVIITSWLKELVIGRDPFDVEVLWEEMYNRTRPVGQAGIMINAISGVDIALWDIIGKALRQPIHRLIGGAFRKEVKAYATGFYRSRDFTFEKAAGEARGYLAQGFRAFKLKVGFGVEEDIAYIHAMREAAGPDICLMADANSAYNAAAARRILYECRDAKLHFFEEPLAPEDIEGYKELKTLSSTYIAAGEQIFGKTGFRRWIAGRALDILQPDLCSSGGITELKKIAALAQAYNTMLIPHVWGSGIGLAASLQFLAAIPPAPLCLRPLQPMLEYDQSEHPFRQDLIFGAIRMTDGFVKIPEEPGIGVGVNEDVIRRFSS